jgi:hypothetical protein
MLGLMRFLCVTQQTTCVMCVNEQFILACGLMNVLLDENSVCHRTDKLRDACE